MEDVEKYLNSIGYTLDDVCQYNKNQNHGRFHIRHNFKSHRSTNKLARDTTQMNVHVVTNIPQQQIGYQPMTEVEPEADPGHEIEHVNEAVGGPLPPGPPHPLEPQGPPPPLEPPVPQGPPPPPEEDISNEEEDGEEEEDDEEEGEGNYIQNGIAACICITLGALAAGLTMGLLSQDLLDLKIKEMASCNPQERKQAKALIPLISDHHRLVSFLYICSNIYMLHLFLCFFGHEAVMKCR